MHNMLTRDKKMYVRQLTTANSLLAVPSCKGLVALVGILAPSADKCSVLCPPGVSRRNSSVRSPISDHVGWTTPAAVHRGETGGSECDLSCTHIFSRPRLQRVAIQTGTSVSVLSWPISSVVISNIKLLPRDAIRKHGLCCRPMSVRPSVCHDGALNRRLSRKRCEIGPSLLWNVNRKS